MYIFFSSNINYDTILLHTLALKFAVTSRKYSLSNPKQPQALRGIPEHSSHLGDIFIIIFGIFPSLGTPSKLRASLTRAFTLASPETCSHLPKPRTPNPRYLRARTSVSAFARTSVSAFTRILGSLHTFEITGLQLKVGATHELKPTSRILLL